MNVTGNKERSFIMKNSNNNYNNTKRNQQFTTGKGRILDKDTVNCQLIKFAFQFSRSPKSDQIILSPYSFNTIYKQTSGESRASHQTKDTFLMYYQILVQIAISFLPKLPVKEQFIFSNVLFFLQKKCFSIHCNMNEQNQLISWHKSHNVLCTSRDN